MRSASLQMSQTMPANSKVAGGPGGPDAHHDNPSMTTMNQPLQRKDEAREMVERWEKDAEEIFISACLLSVPAAFFLAVTLLSVTVQDLRQNGQDSTFYLGNTLADPKVICSSTPSPVAEPPSFSPPRYAVWEITLVSMSLVTSLSCALWTMSLQQWARRYLYLAQPACSRPENRAQMRMHVLWEIERLSTLLQLSIILFFGGVAIFLFTLSMKFSSM